MIHHSITLPFDLGKNGITIFVFGDRQEGSQAYLHEAWQEFKREFKQTPNAWALGLGDYADWLRPTMRRYLDGALVHDDSARSMLDTQILKSHDKIIGNMEFLKGRIIGLHEGHHTWNLMSGINTDQRLASALGTAFLGFAATTRLLLRCTKTNSLSYTIFSAHGCSNSKGVQGAVRWLEEQAKVWIADHYIVGHGCKSAAFSPFERKFVRRDGIPGVDTKIVRCLAVGGFARAYTNGAQSDFVERAGMLPQSIGWGVIRIKTKKDTTGPKGREKKILDVEQTNRYFED